VQKEQKGEQEEREQEGRQEQLGQKNVGGGETLGEYSGDTVDDKCRERGR